MVPSPYPFNLAAYVAIEKIVLFSYLRLGLSSLVQSEFSHPKRGYGIFMQACSQNSPQLSGEAPAQHKQFRALRQIQSSQSNFFKVLEIPSSSFGQSVLDLDHFKAYFDNFLDF